MRFVTILILLTAALSFVGCATESADDESYHQAVDEAQAAERVDNFVRTPAQ